jgi:hypothetical protein
MPHAPEWIHRLTEIHEILRGIPDALLDRSAIATLFQVSPRQANRILKKLGAARAGGAMLISPKDLLARIADLQKEDSVAYEQHRRDRLEQRLTEARREIRARRVQIPLPQAAPLPDQIHFTPGELRIRFTTPLELIEHLLRLAKSASDDWEQFESRAGGAGN